ncbi:MAG: heptosyltransferase-2 [Flavobacteriaceae bacterium]|jgi:heptosyltransferase-2|uniref:glycosyltransferase family 9 protein n=1 Tax=Candidatus Marifrigoribacter sp. Uisw_064 TaxID=3230970 RepID=UPI003AE4B330
MKILIIQQKMIGDVLTSSILFEVLKKQREDCELHYLINSHTDPVVENHLFIDHFIYFTPEIENSYLKFASFLKQVRNNKYDVVIDVYGKLSSNLITLFSGAEIKIGYHKKHTSFIYNKGIKRIKKPEKNTSLAIENRMRLLQPLHIDFENIAPKIYLQESEIAEAKKMLESFQITQSNPLYMISLLGSNPKKTYPAKYMAQLLETIVLEKPNVQLLFNYIPKQLKEAKEIYNLCSKETQDHIYFDLFGKSIRAFLGLTCLCHALIGNEGGAVNMAKALNIPTFIIFNPALNKLNWFGDEESNNNVAVHLADYIEYHEESYNEAKQNPESYYLKFKHTFIVPKLTAFLKDL